MGWRYVVLVGFGLLSCGGVEPTSDQPSESSSSTETSEGDVGGDDSGGDDGDVPPPKDPIKLDSLSVRTAGEELKDGDLFRLTVGGQGLTMFDGTMHATSPDEVHNWSKVTWTARVSLLDPANDGELLGVVQAPVEFEGQADGSLIALPELIFDQVPDAEHGVDVLFELFHYQHEHLEFEFAASGVVEG